MYVEGGDEGMSFWMGWVLGEGGRRRMVKDRL